MWFHAASVGEGLHAKPVLEELRRRHPSWQLFYTHFSQSARPFAEHLDVDGRAFLPLDRARDMAAVVDALAPHLLVFAVADVWPELVAAARARQTRVALISGAVSQHSWRRRWPVTRLLQATYQSLDLVAAATAEDLEALSHLGARRERSHVLGNTRFDSALERAADAQANLWVTALTSDRPTLVAGSTWRADEEVVLPAFAAVLRSHPTARLILAPHAPRPERLAAIAALAGRWNLPAPVSLAELHRVPDPALVVVDRVGHLAHLYATGDVAYVGGGFGRRGLHSVLEPAACGLPVLVGPHWRGSAEALRLHRAGALESLPTRDAAAALTHVWIGYLVDPMLRAEAGRTARRTVEDGTGAAARTAAALETLLGVEASGSADY